MGNPLKKHGKAKRTFSVCVIPLFLCLCHPIIQGDLVEAQMTQT